MSRQKLFKNHTLQQKLKMFFESVLNYSEVESRSKAIIMEKGGKYIFILKNGYCRKGDCKALSKSFSISSVDKNPDFVAFCKRQETYI